MIDELGLTGIIDAALPKTRDHVLPHSAVVKAMLLNGLGFNERRLYIFSQFFSNLATEQLFGSGVTPEHLNDDVLLRTLDRIYEYGSTDLLNKIVMEVMKKFSSAPIYFTPIPPVSASMETMILNAKRTSAPSG